MNVNTVRVGVACVVMLVALVGLTHSWAKALALQGITSGQKADPGTVGQQYQGPKHYKNHDYYTTRQDYLQGGQLYVRDHLQ